LGCDSLRRVAALPVRFPWWFTVSGHQGVSEPQTSLQIRKKKSSQFGFGLQNSVWFSSAQISRGPTLIGGPQAGFGYGAGTSGSTDTSEKGAVERVHPPSRQPLLRCFRKRMREVPEVCFRGRSIPLSGSPIRPRFFTPHLYSMRECISGSSDSPRQNNGLLSKYTSMTFNILTFFFNYVFLYQKKRSKYIFFLAEDLWLSLHGMTQHMSHI